MKLLTSAAFLFVIALRGVAPADDFLVTSKIGGVVIGSVGGQTIIIHVAASAIEQLAQELPCDTFRFLPQSSAVEAVRHARA